MTWLVVDKMDTATAIGFDSLSLKLGAAEDVDVQSYWSGPYIKDMKTTKIGTKSTIQAVFGDQVTICAKVTGDTVVHKPTPSGVESEITPCDANVTGSESHINVMLIKGIDAEALKFLFKQINGREMTEADKTYGNAFDVANNSGEYKSDKLGIPARSKYDSSNPYVIYRFTDNIQN